MLTVLDVINQCLASMALAPIASDEVEGNPYAQSAQAKLTQNTVDTLAKGWWFNERLITTTLPDDLLRVEGNFGRTLSWNGVGIYDHVAGGVIAAPYPAKTLGYVAVPFPDLPPPLQAYIAALTVIAFQAEFDGSETKLKQLAAEVDRALVTVQEVDRNSRVNYKRLWELLAYGWWFNTLEFTAPVGTPAGIPASTLSVQGPPQMPLFLDPVSGAICQTWTARPITTEVERARAIVQVAPEALPPAAAEWLRKASALDYERESLNPEPRVLADLNQQLDVSWAALRRENGERMILREQSRDFQARGWWFNTFPLVDEIAAPTLVLTGPTPTSIGLGESVTGTIENTGLVPADFVLSSSLEATIEPSTGTLAAGASIGYTITPDVGGLHTVTLTNGADGDVTGSPASFSVLALAPAPVAAFVGHVVADAGLTFFAEEVAPSPPFTVEGAPTTARAAFLTAIAEAQSFGFEGAEYTGASAPIVVTFDGSEVVPITATLTGAGSVLGAESGGRFNTTPGGSQYWAPTESGGSYVTLNFSRPVSAFGFYATDIGDVAGQLSVRFTDEDDVVTTHTVEHSIGGVELSGALLFWGYINTTKKYKKVELFKTGGPLDGFGFDDFVVADLGQIDPIVGPAPLQISFEDLSTDATGWAWEFTNSGTTDSTAQNPTHTYTTPGSYTVRLTVTNSGGVDTITRTAYVLAT